jgi:two-component system chemotaxis response regulator CheB
MTTRVLVVDDSAFARKVVREVLTGAGFDVVGIARDGLEALEKISELKPDVVTLDLVMPNLDGLGVLAALQSGNAPRVVVVSMAGEESALGIAALHAGAVVVVRKPTALALDRLYDLSSELITAVRTAAAARSPRPVDGTVPHAGPVPSAAKHAVLVLGASTGGPQALTRIIKSLPGKFPLPVALVLHLPPGYTQPFAERLDRDSDVEVLEAEEGLEMRPGRVMVARAGMHLRLRRVGHEVRAALDLHPADTPHRPSVDVLFESAAQAYGARVLAAVLTGMGNDGTRGAQAIHAAGGMVLTEAEHSCVVYGMPRCVVEAGVSAGSFGLDLMASEILRRL